MTCDGTAFGTERSRPDWTEAELDLLDQELALVRSRYALELRKQFPTDKRVDINVQNRSLRSDLQKELEAREHAVYEQAHDRHFLRVIRQNAERSRAHHPHQR